jgi:MoaA/NifB/PqqE/SkfB family radical SAM enzyme
MGKRLNNIGYLSKAGYAVLKSKVLCSHTPLIVSWNLTNKCNLRCKYCSNWSHSEKRVNKEDVFKIIDELVKNGCIRINFTGGEPLLIPEAGSIINYAKKKGLIISLSTNGVLLKRRLEEVKEIGMLIISLDGPKKVHDSIRGEGSFRKAIDAIRLAKKNKIKVVATCTLTKYNIGYGRDLLILAKRYGFKICFQPVSELALGSPDISGLQPRKKEFRKEINALIDIKKNSQLGKHNSNSLSGLKYLLNWPDYKSIGCCAGIIYCAIDPEGNLFSCSDLRDKTKGVNILKHGFKKAFYSLKKVSCKSCWCSSQVEMNLLLNLNFSSIKNAAGNLM